MKIKKAIYETVFKETKKLVTPAIYGCDQCGKELTDKLTTTAFDAKGEYKDYDYCSWKCVMEHLPTISEDCDNIIDLPTLLFQKDENMSGTDLVEIIKEKLI